MTTNEYEYDTKVTVVPNDADGFKYWTKNGQIVSYDPEYSFYVSAETINVVAVSDGDSTLKPVISLTSTSLGLIDGKTKYALFSDRNINGAGTFIESGILIGESSEVSLDAYINRGVSVSTIGKGQFTVRKSVASGQTYYAKAYMIYKDTEGDIQYIYSNCVELAYVEE